MDNTNKSKNWIHRLRHFKILGSQNSQANNENLHTNAEVFLRNSAFDRDDATNHSNKCNSFRRSLKKIRARVKGVFHQNGKEITLAIPNARRHTSHINYPFNPPGSSNTSYVQRISLSSPVIPTQNLYSIGPVKKVENNTYLLQEESLVARPHSTNSASRNILTRLPSQYFNQDVSNLSDIDKKVPEIPPRNISPQQQQLSRAVIFTEPTSCVNELAGLRRCCWYWGSITRYHAEDRLEGCPDGSFLVRDSESERYLFTMSFRSLGRTLHTRIDRTAGGYTFLDQTGYRSVVELINDAMVKSKSSIYCYTRASVTHVMPNFPVRIYLPISRYDKGVPSLKHLSRFVIRQCININDVDVLPLPSILVGYVKEENFIHTNHS